MLCKQTQNRPELGSLRNPGLHCSKFDCEYSKGNVITKSQHTQTASISMYMVLALTVVYDPSDSNGCNRNVTFSVEIQNG